MAELELDVAIVGGGLAGGCLARQLQRRLPGLRIGVFERRQDAPAKVGESLVEIGNHYLATRLQLQRYLDENHLPKNGLRFFFDSPDRATALPHMGEIGTQDFPVYPSFQVDRARLDADLRAMNRAAGVDVRTGWIARRARIGEGNAPHGLVVEDPAGDPLQVRARWLVDASGRARWLQRNLDQAPVELTHRIGSVWGRFEGVLDVDGLGPPAWRARVDNTPRYLSTNHFGYPGYWIWFIPLGAGKTSVGVCAAADRITPDLRRPDGFRAFLRRHRAVRDLLEGARAIDTMSFGQLGYGTRSFYGPPRTAFIGEAAAFPDPFYSPGTDLIALQNDFLTELVAREAEGAAPAALDGLHRLFDGYLALRFDAAMLVYRDLYPILGSFDVYGLRWRFDIQNYYNLWFDPYFRGLHLDPAYLREQLAQREVTLTALANFSRLFDALGQAAAAGELRSPGNLDRFAVAMGGLEHCVEAVGTPRTRKDVLRATAAVFDDVRTRALGLLGRSDRPLGFPEYFVDRALV